MSDRAASSVAAAAVLFFGIVAAGCGENAAARNKCLDRAFFLAKADLVRAEFNASRLGTPKHVLKELVEDYRMDGGTVSVRSIKKNLFFDARGKVIAWSRLRFAQQTEFDEWVSHSQRINTLLRKRHPGLWEHVKATAKC
jgi:hypothetical protein